MPFTATLNLQADNAGDSYPLPNVYFRMDDNNTGGEDDGWTGTLRAYFSIDVCNNDVGDDIGQFAQSARRVINTAYVPGADPIAALDAAAMALFPDATVASDIAVSIAKNQQALSRQQQSANQLKS